MKQIQPITIWYNGQIIEANKFIMTSTNDNLVNNANFNYNLYHNDTIVLAQGNLTMNGTDYINYSSSPDSNEYAYQWGATQLNLTLV